MDEAVAVLDVGKTHTKLSLVDRSGHVLAIADRANRALVCDGRKVLDAEGIASWLLPALRELPLLAQISAIVPVAHGATAALMTGDTLAAPVLDYEYEPPARIAEAYTCERDAFTHTLSPRLPAGLNLGVQLFWQEQPETQILLWPQYWAWWLSGERASEVTSLGCHTDMWRPRESRYSELAKRNGWDVRLPKIVPAWEAIGRIRSDIADTTGLPADCEVLCGLHDSNAALHALRGRQQSAFTAVSTGTWFVAMQNGLLPQLNPQFDTLANVDCEGRPVATARFMGGRNYEEAMGSDVYESAAPQDVFALIDNDTHKHFVFDAGTGKYRIGDSTMFASPSAARRAAYASLYLALNTCAALDHIDASGPVFLEGRFARNAAFAAALARLRPQSPVYVCEEADGVAFGAARLRWPDMPLPGAVWRMSPDGRSHVL